MDYIIEVNSSDITYDIIVEGINRGIPDNIQRQLKSNKTRQKLLSKFGTSAFLLPAELKFPIIRPDSRNGKPCCQLVYAAYVRSRQWSRKKPQYQKVAAEAKKIFENNNCDIIIGVKLEENLTSYPLLLDTVLDLLDEGLDNTKSMYELVLEAISNN